MKERRGGILTEPEAKAVLYKRLSEKKRVGEIPFGVQYEVDINSDTQYVQGVAYHYYIGWRLIYPNGQIVEKMASVHAMTGNCTFQDAFGKVTGHEKPHIVNLMEKFYRDAERHGKFLRMFRGGGGGGQ